MNFLRKNKILVFFLIIIIIACFFRIYKLDSIPPGIWPDEAINANQAINEPGKIFYPENHGREGFFFNLIALSFGIFGVSIWSLKIVSALIGILTVLGFYLLLKEVSKRLEYIKNIEYLPLLSSLFLAVSFWHINFSRISFRAILVPFVLVFSFYFLFKGFREKKISNLILGGLFFGLGFHTYISFRTAVLLLLLILIIYFFVYLKNKQFRQFALFSSITLFFVFIAALPIGIYFLNNPQDFVTRAMPISVFHQENPASAFLQSLAKHIGMFNIYGDPNWRHNYAGAPQLFFPIGILFLWGIAHAVKRIFLWRKTGFAALIYVFFFAWLFTLMLPSILTIEGIPHALRTIGAIPAAYFFAGIGACLFLLWLKEFLAKKRLKPFAYYLLVAVFLFIAVAFPFYRYFFDWASKPELSEAFTLRFVETGNILNSLPLEARKFVIKSEGDLPTETSKFIQKTAGRDDALYLNKEDVLQINFIPGDFVLTMNKERFVLDKIIEKFPEGQLQEFERVWLYKIK